MKTKQTKAEKEQMKAAAIERLRKMCPVGSTVYTVRTHVSSSGMSRRFKLLVIRTQGGQPDLCDISGSVSEALGYHWHDDGSVRIGGCGMDMGFAIVSDLASVLHGRYDSLRKKEGV